VPVDGGESFNPVGRIERFGNARDNTVYKVYYSAVRGEVYTYNPQIKKLYTAYVEWVKAGKFEEPKPEVNLNEEKPADASVDNREAHQDQ
jgi:hypothetical protein